MVFKLNLVHCAHGLVGTVKLGTFILRATMEFNLVFALNVNLY